MSSSFPQGAGNRSRQTPDNIRTLWQQSMPPPLPATTSRGMGVLDIADNVPPSRMPELPWPFDRSPSQTLLGTADPAFVYSDRSSPARSDTPSSRNEASSARSTNELRTILVPQAVVDPRFHMRDFALVSRSVVRHASSTYLDQRALATSSCTLPSLKENIKGKRSLAFTMCEMPLRFTHV